jgi:hypothetical protein
MEEAEVGGHIRRKKMKRTKNKEETPSSIGVVWAYILCCWASKSSCILVFSGFRKKNKSAGPRL